MRILPSHLLLIKPPPAVARLLDELRDAHGLAAAYAAAKLHLTLLPLGHVPDRIDVLKAILAAFAASPFRVVFDRIDSTVLRPSERIRGLEAFQRALVDHLVRHGLPRPGYAFRPHISLSYGDHRPGSFVIDPVSWRVDSFQLVESFRGRHRLRGHWPLTAATPPSPARYRDTGRDRPPSPAAP